MGDFVVEIVNNVIDFVIYKFTKPRQWIWYIFYQMIGFFSHNGCDKLGIGLRNY